MYQEKGINKKVYNNIMNLIKLYNRIDTIFMNSENTKTSDPKYVALSNISIYYTWKNIKKSYDNNKFKIPALNWAWMKSLN